MKASWTEAARQEFDEIVSYVLQQSEKNASLVLERIRKTISVLCNNPGIGRPSPNGTSRVMLVAKTGYLIVYSLEDGKLEILSVRRGARKHARPS